MEERLLVEVHYTIKEGKRDEFLKEVMESGIAEASRKEVGNGRYDYFYPVEDQNQIVLFEEWNTVEDQKKHAQTEHYHILSKLKEIYVEKTQISTINIG